MNENEILLMIFVLLIGLGCAACFGYINHTRRLRGEPIYCKCLGLEDSPRVHYRSLDAIPEEHDSQERISPLPV